MLNVGHAIHYKDWNYSDVSSPFTRIYYVTEGTAEVCIYGKTHSLREGNLYIIPAFTTHTDICDSRFSHYYVHIYEDAKVSFENLTDNYDFPFEIEGNELDRTLFEILCDHNQGMILKHSDPRLYDNEHSLIECVRLNRNLPAYVRLESMGIIYSLLSRFVKAATPKYQSTDIRIKSALKKIQMEIGKTIPVNELAGQACMSTDHFIRLFRQEVGMTPVQFMIERRMTSARLMLATESMPIKMIAYRLGYDNISYFSRVFKRHTGMTPLEYRHSFNHLSHEITIDPQDSICEI